MSSKMQLNGGFGYPKAIIQEYYRKMGRTNFGLLTKFDTRKEAERFGSPLERSQNFLKVRYVATDKIMTRYIATNVLLPKVKSKRFFAWSLFIMNDPSHVIHGL